MDFVKMRNNEIIITELYVQAGLLGNFIILTDFFLSTIFIIILLLLDWNWMTCSRGLIFWCQYNFRKIAGSLLHQWSPEISLYNDIIYKAIVCTNYIMTFQHVKKDGAKIGRFRPVLFVFKIHLLPIWRLLSFPLFPKRLHACEVVNSTNALFKRKKKLTQNLLERERNWHNFLLMTISNFFPNPENFAW